MITKEALQKKARQLGVALDTDAYVLHDRDRKSKGWHVYYMKHRPWTQERKGTLASPMLDRNKLNAWLDGALWGIGQ